VDVNFGPRMVLPPPSEGESRDPLIWNENGSVVEAKEEVEDVEGAGGGGGAKLGGGGGNVDVDGGDEADEAVSVDGLNSD
jgi:hypothetical protein